jgi:hypothetical protein
VQNPGIPSVRVDTSDFVLMEMSVLLHNPVLMEA